MFRNAKKVLVLIGCMFAAILIAACERGEQDNPNAEFEAAKAAQEEATKAAQAAAIEKAQEATKAAQEEAVAQTAALDKAQEEASKAGVLDKAQKAAQDPCRKLVCSTDDAPWLGCRYAAALYRDAPGTVPGVRHVVSILKPDQLAWYREALLTSYRNDLWYSADYRMGDATDLNQSARDVRIGIFGDKDTYKMDETAICEQLGSTDITLADIIAASRANSPFVAKKKVPKEGSLYLRDPFEATPPAEPAAPTTEPSCGADPCPPPSDPAKVELETLDDEVEPGPSGDQVAPATPPTEPAAPPAEPSCGADPCPPQNAAPVPPDPATPPANPVPAEPPATDPAAPSEPGGAAPPAKSGEGTVAYYSGHGF